MGMDIYGIEPVKRTQEPVIEWESSDDKQKIEYYESKRQYELENPGVYFRANIWAWRPIAVIIQEINSMYALSLPEDFIKRINENSGAGLKTQAECDKLANFIESYVENNFKDWDTIGLNTGFYSKMVVGNKGEMHSIFITDEEGIKVHTFVGDEPFIKNGIIDFDNKLYRTSHSVGLDGIHTFVAFLRECGGFEIW